METKHNSRYYYKTIVIPVHDQFPITCLLTCLTHLRALDHLTRQHDHCLLEGQDGSTEVD